MKFFLKSIGCRTNQSEIEEIAAALLRAGFESASRPDDADIAIINTCAVTSEAERKSVLAVKQALKSCRKVVVTGCLVEMPDNKLSQLAERLVIFGNASKDLVGAWAIMALLGSDSRRSYSDSVDPLFAVAPGLRSRKMIKIQEGCDHFCSYCIVPYLRGAPRSIASSEIVCKAQRLVAAGAKEIVLVGTNIGRYWDPKAGIGLVGLIQLLLEIPAAFRIRLSSLEPQDFPRELVEVVAGLRRICRHFHIPLQSGSSRVLEAMGRSYTYEQYSSLIWGIRSRLPEAAITTDIIVGFPGETEEDFETTLAAVKELEFSKLHVFRYSPRPGTAAARFGDQVSSQEKTRRSEKLIELGIELSLAYKRKFIGSILEFVLERNIGRGMCVGMSDNYIRATIVRRPSAEDGPETLRGEFLYAEVREVSNDAVTAIEREAGKEACGAGVSFLQDNKR